jgi:hypothetical protein
VTSDDRAEFGGCFEIVDRLGEVAEKIQKETILTSDDRAEFGGCFEIVNSLSEIAAMLQTKQSRIVEILVRLRGKSQQGSYFRNWNVFSLQMTYPLCTVQ